MFTPEPPAEDRQKQPLPEEPVHIVVGNSRLSIQAEIPPRTRLTVTVESDATGDVSVVSRKMESVAPVKTGLQISSLRGAAGTWRRPVEWGIHRLRSLDLEIALFALALLVYLLVRLISLPDFPIYFFTDEASQTVLASDLVRDGFFSTSHEFLPAFFYNGYQYNLGTSVYWQVVPYLLFGKSVWATRGASALAALLAAACAGMALKKIFKVPYAWGAVLLLSAAPAWFLHSRTAFETSLAVSFYTAYLYFYMLYRTDSPRYLYTALVMGALAFYTYSPVRLVVVLTGLLLLVSDLRYHWQQRKTTLYGLGLVALLVLPFLRFEFNHPGESLRHLQGLGSYWVNNESLSQKVLTYFNQYLAGLNPFYWYLPNGLEIPRHTMKGYGHISAFMLPFLVLGLIIAVRRFRQSPYRVLLIGLLAAPSGAALVGLGVTRALVMVFPATLLGAVGLVACLKWVEKRAKMNRTALSWLVFAGLAASNFWMLRDALVNGPLWYSDYSLTGMQYGARQVFGAVGDYLKQQPQTHIILSPTWANGADVIARFFFPDPLPFEIGSIAGFIEEYRPFDAKTLFIMAPAEVDQMYSSGKFTDIKIEKTLPYPDGSPGFYFIRLRYADGVEQIFARERSARQVLQEKALVVGGFPANVRYSFLDMGSIEQIFNGDPSSLIRTAEANPMKVFIEFLQERTVSSVSARVGGTPTRVTLQLYEPQQASPIIFDKEVGESTDPRTVEFVLEHPYQVSGLHLLIENTRDGEPSHVHLWQVVIK
jgi:4-amino-4-deoxy-L-arabinose transferase-like glycosyltransferase